MEAVKQIKIQKWAVGDEEAVEFDYDEACPFASISAAGNWPTRIPAAVAR